MKLITKSAVFFTPVILGTIVFLAGCATTGMQRSTKTGATMKAVEQDYLRAIAQVDATGASLENLVKPGQANVKKAFEKYSSNVNKMEDLKKRLFEHADKMNAQGKEYFKEWRKQGNTYSNPRIQALSEHRRAELSATFTDITVASVGVKGAFKSYMSNIKQMKTYLSNDLTPEGVESITPIAKRSVRDGVNLKNAVNPVLSAIGSARKELAQGGTRN
jgi:hypothetical protein